MCEGEDEGEGECEGGTNSFLCSPNLLWIVQGMEIARVACASRRHVRYAADWSLVLIVVVVVVVGARAAMEN